MNTETLEPSQTAQAISQQYKAQTVDSLAARNSHLADPETLDLLIDAASNGLNNQDACLAAGLHPKTLIRWHELAEANPDSAQATFVQALKRARSAGKLAVLKRIQTASEKPQFWTAGAWLLERTDPEQFALRKDDSNAPRVIVQIGARDSDVQVTIHTDIEGPSPVAFASDAPAQGAVND